MENIPNLNLKKANKPSGSPSAPREADAVTPSTDGKPAGGPPTPPQTIGGLTLKKRAPGDGPAPPRPAGPGGPTGLRTGGYQGGGGGFAPRPAPTNNRMNRFSREMPSRDPGVRMNENIRVPEIRVIDDEGQVGVMSPREALEIARERGVDLIEIVPNAQPPVCKLIDFGKWKYEQQKRDKAQKKTQHQQLLKEVRFHPSTDTHDFEFKTRHAREFLLEGHKVKATVQFKGREVTYKQFGEELLNKFLARLLDISKIDQQIGMLGKQMTVVISPTAKKKKEEPKKDDGIRDYAPKKEKKAKANEPELSEAELEAALLADPSGESSIDDDNSGEMEVVDNGQVSEEVSVTSDDATEAESSSDESEETKEV